MNSQFETIVKENGFLFPWSSIKYYKPMTELAAYMEKKYIESYGGEISAAA